MSKKKESIQLILYIIIFFLVWTLYEFFIKVQITASLPLLLETFIQGLIKLSIWTLPAYLLIKKNQGIQIPAPDLYTTKIQWKKWLILIFAFIVYLLVGSYLQFGNLQIRDSFQLISVFNVVLLVGVTEELVFRGWILNSLLTKMSKWSAIIISSTLFILIHFPIWLISGTFKDNILSGGFITVFVLGIIFSLSFIKSQNIFVPIILHMVWNLFTIMFYG